MKKSMPGDIPVRPPAPPGEEKTVYEKEIQAYSCILRGDREGTKNEIRSLLEKKAKESGLPVEPDDEARYRCAEIINLAARCAAQKGADEGFCLKYADETVATADKMTDKDEIYSFIPERCGALAELTAGALARGDYPFQVRKATEYIAANIREPLTVTEIAGVCGLSPDYLSLLFRRVTGERMTAYIRKRKLLAARELLKRNRCCSEVAKKLSFCSESYFVKCFKDEFGVTPKKYKNGCHTDYF